MPPAELFPRLDFSKYFPVFPFGLKLGVSLLI